MKHPYGMVARYREPEELLDAVRRVRAAGYARWDTYTPFPLSELLEMQAPRLSRVSVAMCCGGVFAGCFAFGMLEWATHAYPLNVGGRPLDSWPSFVPITFELTILGATLTGLVTWLILSGLPRLDHPMFLADDFERASQDRFFLCVEAADPRFHAVDVRRLLEETGAEAVEEIWR